ncbi:hypothetical protein SARC_05948 [Sphaeroforma arctica JP610]|uniref:Uncharacterized protein n=1 Tax=Sphaeroforma arctica JP610 TaxID=667725 RepID=A0A0L0FYV9_9EUKA|nr:hypothetical protein SARC_05948 [Sphaeroforma arctica JP610]KNC81746.1 hypothetical protein SARC_05948 [Sphaeroforma arctica JP610]|eukprot:XP_014155648.1 hypothetical protein SARC_05948 [Sphaeroforma arctica JP610]
MMMRYRQHQKVKIKAEAGDDLDSESKPAGDYDDDHGPNIGLCFEADLMESASDVEYYCIEMHRDSPPLAKSAKLPFQGRMAEELNGKDERIQAKYVREQPRQVESIRLAQRFFRTCVRQCLMEMRLRNYHAYGSKTIRIKIAYG